MIICEDNVYKIKNWDKYQSADKYEVIKEQNRERQRRFREKNKIEENRHYFSKIPTCTYKL